MGTLNKLLGGSYFLHARQAENPNASHELHMNHFERRDMMRSRGLDLGLLFLLRKARPCLTGITFFLPRENTIPSQHDIHIRSRIILHVHITSNFHLISSVAQDYHSLRFHSPSRALYNRIIFCSRAPLSEIPFS